MKILLVDDDADLLSVTGFALQQAGFLVVKAVDGVAALEAFEREHPHLAVLDINMPRMNGFDLAQKLRERSRIPVIMLTARSEEGDVVRALSLGADDYLSKPFSPKILIARVKALLRRAGAEANDAVAVGCAVARRAGAHAIRSAARAGAAHAARGALSPVAVRACRPDGLDGSIADSRLGQSRRRQSATAEAARAQAAAEDRGRSGRSAARPQRAERGLSAGPGGGTRAPRRSAA